MGIEEGRRREDSEAKEAGEDFVKYDREAGPGMGFRVERCFD